MRIDFHIKEVVITAKQKALFERKLQKLKKFIDNDDTVIELYLKDESSAEKGGVDQSVEIKTVFLGQKVFVRELDDRLPRAFAYAFRSFERQIQRIHQKKVEKSHEGSDWYISRALKALRLKK